MSGEELWRLSAAEAIERLEAGEVTPLDLVEASAERIAETEGALNAMPILCLDRAREQARRLMDQGPPAEKPRGWLAGLPVAIKDLEDTAGVRTTYGSPIFADHVPERSSLLVERLEERGAIVVGKANTPEFGAGASTFNEVFGRTCNPWNGAKSVAGSSGGSAAALAAGQVWLASGSDLGGSLRNPASFNGIVGLRPAPGRVPKGPPTRLYANLSVAGPMARTALDTAIFLDALSGAHIEDPLSLAAPEQSFADAVREAQPPKRVAYSPDLGVTPVDPEVAALCRAAAARFEAFGCVVEEASPDLSGAHEIFQTLRAVGFAADEGELLQTHRDQMKPDVVWNIEKGLALTAEEIARAERERAKLFRRMLAFFEGYDLLLTPATVVPPYPVEWRTVEELNGQKFETYIDWLAIAFAITLTTCPALSAPAGLTAEGLPVGLQIVGPPRGEAATLAAAHLLEQQTGLADLLPIDPRPGGAAEPARLVSE